MDEREDGNLSFWDIKDPRTVLGQTRAVALMRSDKRASYKHFALLEFHWGWSHQDHNYTSLASVRKIHTTLCERNPLGEASISLPHINAANRDLVEWGWLFELDKGKGQLGTRFLPNYAIFKIAAEGNFRSFLTGQIVFSVNLVGERNGYGISVHLIGNTGVTYEVNANRFCVHPLGNKDSLTVTVLKDGLTERDIDPAPATPPLADGLRATAAGGAGGGFEELWKAYGYRQKKADAKAAYLKLAPDDDLHSNMVSAAVRWKTSWAAQGKADAPRFTLRKWIEREEYECDPPLAFVKKAGKKLKAAPANDNAQPAAPAPVEQSSALVCDVGPRSPVGTFNATILGSVVDPITKKIALHLSWTDPENGPDAVHTFHYEHPNNELQDRGQAFLGQIANALGFDQLDDAEQLAGQQVRCTINSSRGIAYQRIAENDNTHATIAA